MSWPDALASVAMLAFVAFIVWVCARPTSTRGDDRHVQQLAKLVVELAALRDHLDRISRPAVKKHEPKHPVANAVCLNCGGPMVFNLAAGIRLHTTETRCADPWPRGTAEAQESHTTTARTR